MTDLNIQRTCFGKSNQNVAVKCKFNENFHNHIFIMFVVNLSLIFVGLNAKSESFISFSYQNIMRERKLVRILLLLV